MAHEQQGLHRYMKTWMLSTNIEVIMIHLPCCTSLVWQMVTLWMIALYSDTSEYGRTLSKKIRLRWLNQPKIPYIQTQSSPSGPKIPYLWTGIWSFLGPKIPHFPDRHMRELLGASSQSLTWKYGSKKKFPQNAMGNSARILVQFSAHDRVQISSGLYISADMHPKVLNFWMLTVS